MQLLSVPLFNSEQLEELLLDHALEMFIIPSQKIKNELKLHEKKLILNPIVKVMLFFLKTDFLEGRNVFVLCDVKLFHSVFQILD